jgi:predicted transcriptional regulator
MPQFEMRNFHLPLPDEVYQGLRQEAERSSKPATVLARQAIELWLRRRRKLERHRAIAEFAAENAGTSLDLDTELESASVAHLGSPSKGKR